MCANARRTRAARTAARVRGRRRRSFTRSARGARARGSESLYGAARAKFPGGGPARGPPGGWTTTPTSIELPCPSLAAGSSDECQGILARTGGEERYRVEDSPFPGAPEDRLHRRGDQRRTLSRLRRPRPTGQTAPPRRALAAP